MRRRCRHPAWSRPDCGGRRARGGLPGEPALRLVAVLGGGGAEDAAEGLWAAPRSDPNRAVAPVMDYAAGFALPALRNSLLPQFGQSFSVDAEGWGLRPARAGQADAGPGAGAGVPGAWVTGDEVYGANPALRAGLEASGVGYVLAVACDRHVRFGGTSPPGSTSCSGESGQGVAVRVGRQGRQGPPLVRLGLCPLGPRRSRASRPGRTALARGPPQPSPTGCAGRSGDDDIRPAAEPVKAGETTSYADLMSASGEGSLIQATVGSFGGDGGWCRNRAGLAA